MTDVDLVEQIFEHVRRGNKYSSCYIKALGRALRILKWVDCHKMIDANSFKVMDGDMYVKWSEIEEVFR